MTLQDSDISAPTSRMTSSLNWIVEYMVEYDRMRIMESLALFVHKDGICQHSSPEKTMVRGRLKVAPAADFFAGDAPRR